MTIELEGERLVLLAHRALWWPRRRTLLIADLHAGKDAAFRAAAIPIPHQTFASDLTRLADAVAVTRAKHLLVLGDLAHHRSGWTRVVTSAFATWRAAHANLKITLLRGNHDNHAGDPPAPLDIECRSGAMDLPPFRLSHTIANGGPYTIAGHVHPAIQLHRKGFGTATLPCFYIGESHALLPAFGRFTGLALVHPNPGERVYAIANSEVIEIPTSA